MNDANENRVKAMLMQIGASTKEIDVLYADLGKNDVWHKLWSKSLQSLNKGTPILPQLVPHTSENVGKTVKVKKDRTNPLSVDQGKYWNSKMKKIKGSPSLKNTVVNMQVEEKSYLLDELSKMELELNTDVAASDENQRTVRASMLLSQLESLQPEDQLNRSNSVDKKKTKKKKVVVKESQSLDEQPQSHFTVSSPSQERENKCFSISESDEDNETSNILRRIGQAMDTKEFKKMNIDISNGRKNLIMLSQTALRERMINDFKMNLSGKDIMLLMKKFDVDKRGIVNLTNIVGNAKGLYDRQKYLQHFKEIENTKLMARKEFYAKQHKKRLAVQEEKAANDPQNIANSKLQSDVAHLVAKLAEVMLKHVHSPSSDVFDNLSRGPPVVSSGEFRNVMKEIGLILSNREQKLLEMRYAAAGEDGGVDMEAFRFDFNIEDCELVRDSNRVEAQQSFVQTLQEGKGKPPLSVSMASTASAASIAEDISIAEDESLAAVDFSRNMGDDGMSRKTSFSKMDVDESNIMEELDNVLGSSMKL